MIPDIARYRIRAQDQETVPPGANANEVRYVFRQQRADQYDLGLGREQPGRKTVQLLENLALAFSDVRESRYDLLPLVLAVAGKCP